jgi:hypothetical protein
MTRLSGKSIRDVITKGPVTRKQLEAALIEGEVDFNEALLTGFIEQAAERWLVTDDEGVMSVKQRTNTGGGAPTALFKVANHLKPLQATVKEMKYDPKVEEDDPLAKRTANQAVRAAKAAWYNEIYVPQLEAYTALQASVAPEKKEAPADEGESEAA